MRTNEAKRQQAKAQWLSTKEAAEMLGGVTTDQVCAWIENGQLQAFDASLEPGVTRPDWRIAPEWAAACKAKRTKNAA